MSKGVYVFTYKNNEIHTRFIEGEYWFVATDIVRAVGASAKNTTQIIRKLPESSRMLYLHEIPTRPNGINTWHIDEQGLRLLLDWPTKPEAAILLDYIESEILPVLPMLHAKAEKEELEAAPSVAKPSENVPMVIPKEEPKEVQEEIRIFESPLFGKIRTVDIDEKIYFVARDVALALGYHNPNEALSYHCKGVAKCYTLTNGGRQLMNVIPEGDIYRLVAHSELPSAQAFESWVFDEVLPKEESKEVQEDVLSVRINQSQEQVVSGRMLHTFLEIGTEYAKWFTRICEYGFTEGEDFRVIVKNDEIVKCGRPSTDHELHLDMAKEICMLARNERGKQARQYFLQLEKDWNSPEKVMARALLMANVEIGDLKVLTAKQEEKIAEQAETIATLEPKAKIYDKVMNTESTCTVSDVAISNGWQSSALFKLLRTNGWLDKRSNAKHHVSRKAPKGVFKVIKGIYGEQIRVTQEGYKQITALIKENE